MQHVAILRHQRHAVLALRHEHRIAARDLDGVARGSPDFLRRTGAAAGCLGEFLAVRRQDRGAVINREIQVLRIDDGALAHLARGVDGLADHAMGEHALGVIGQQHDVRARQRFLDRGDQLRLGLGRRGLRHFPVRTQHMRGVMLGDEAHLARGRPRRINDEMRLNGGILRQFAFQGRARGILADQADENAATAERCDVARDVTRATDIEFAALGRDHRRRRFGRHARDFAIDELVQHQIADAQNGLARHPLRQRIEINHESLNDSDPDDRENLSRKKQPNPRAA
ncbi:hypothetical protein BN961_00745 [Afipia felis]|uniref:Uncharacterized protein n=1 Tax=Afipia felis TaxID=1035 RepID=A0A090MIR8_AFIFE|nr:hypothetical protein BN961_00745 [Afipia felis]